MIKQDRTRLPWSVLIKNDSTATGVYVCTSRESVENGVTGWEPRPAVVIKATKKFFPGELRGLQKLGLGMRMSYAQVKVEDLSSYIYCLRIERFVPRRIEPAHTTGKIGAIPILGLNIVRVLRNTIINSVERFDKFLKSRSTCVLARHAWVREEYLVEFQPKTFDFWVVRSEL
jgi:hypothetical protein